MAVFIQGAGVISPQKTWGGEILDCKMLQPLNHRFCCVEPDYSTFIDAKMIRRMSRIIKMGVCSSMISLKDAAMEKPDAVIVGTALGCLEDTVSFLNKLVINKEELLNPTAFIHSTHNTIASQIALIVKCMGYNSTYVHRNISFESAVTDALLLLNENEGSTVLVGGIDELTDVSFEILNRLGYFVKANASGSDVRSGIADAGEGAAFFTLSNTYREGAYAEIKTVQTISFCSLEEVEEKALNMFATQKLDKVDLIFSGSTGSPGSKQEFEKMYSLLGSTKQVYSFKQLCGEYPTSAAFGMYLAASILRTGKLPAMISNELHPERQIRNILIHNNFKNIHHSLLLLAAC